MRGRSILAFGVSFLLAVAVLAQGSGETKAKAAPKSAAHKPVIWPAGDLKWVDAPGAPSDVKIVPLWGDSTKGAYGALEKFPAGFTAGLHTHSAQMRMVMVSGTLIHGPEGKPEVRLGAGSYLMMPSNYRHTTACDKSSDCIFFVESNGKFDINMVDAAAKK